MAIAPSKLGQFVDRAGFSAPTRDEREAPREFDADDAMLVRRLREAGLVRPEATDNELAATFRAARSEHVEHNYSIYNSPHERVRVFLEPYLTSKGLKWAVPLESLDLPDDDGGGGARSGWFWKR